MVATVETYAQTQSIFTKGLIEPCTYVVEPSSCGGYRNLGISQYWRLKRGLITKASIKFHPHGDVPGPCCGYQSDVSCFDWRNQEIRYHGVLITVSIKHLQ